MIWIYLLGAFFTLTLYRGFDIEDTLAAHSRTIKRKRTYRVILRLLVFFLWPAVLSVMIVYFILWSISLVLVAFYYVFIED